MYNTYILWITSTQDSVPICRYVIDNNIVNCNFLLRKILKYTKGWEYYFTKSILYKLYIYGVVTLPFSSEWFVIIKEEFINSIHL